MDVADEWPGGHHDAMDTLLGLWRSTVGRKALVAASGLLLWLWVVLHVAGNLTVFSGPEAADGYAACERCGRHVALQAGDLAGLCETVRALTGFACDFSHFPLVGACPDCEAAR